MTTNHTDQRPRKHAKRNGEPVNAMSPDPQAKLDAPAPAPEAQPFIEAHSRIKAAAAPAVAHLLACIQKEKQ